MELRHLRGFLAAAEEGSVTRAAARLYIAQPALTRQMHELERDVGGQLFVRHARGIRLTEAGLRLYDEAQVIVARADALLKLAGDAADDDRRTLTVGMLDEGAAELNGPILAAVQAAHPRARIAARAVAWGPHSEQLRTGQLDAIIGPRYALNDGDVRVTPLFSDGRLAVLSAKHPLADADRISFRDLLGVSPLPLTGLPQPALDHFLCTEPRGEPGPREDMTRPFVMADGLAATAAGQSFITVTTATGRFFHHPGVVFREVPDAPPTDTVLATKPDGDASTDLLESLVSLAGVVARSLIELVPGATAAHDGPAAPPRQPAAATP